MQFQRVGSYEKMVFGGDRCIAARSRTFHLSRGGGLSCSLSSPMFPLIGREMLRDSAGTGGVFSHAVHLSRDRGCQSRKTPFLAPPLTLQSRLRSPDGSFGWQMHSTTSTKPSPQACSNVRGAGPLSAECENWSWTVRPPRSTCLRIPRPSGHRFHDHPATHSTMIRPPIP